MSAAWEIVRTDAGCHLRLEAANGEIVLVSKTWLITGDAGSAADALAAQAIQAALSTSAMRSVDETDGHRIEGLPYACWEVVTTAAGVHLRLRVPVAEVSTVVLVSEPYTDARPAARAVQLAVSTFVVRSVDERSEAGR